MAWSIAPALHFVPSVSSLAPLPSSSSSSSITVSLSSSLHSHSSVYGFRDPSCSAYPSLSTRPQRIAVLQSFAFSKNVPEYKFPDPIPEFAEAETEKFRAHLRHRFSKRPDVYGDEKEAEESLEICTKIFSTFLHTEYGGPGTLMPDPFAEMADTLNEEGLPGGPQAARAAVKWAQAHVDKDWNEWTGDDN